MIFCPKQHLHLTAIYSYILLKFSDCQEHVSNKSAYLCGVMKTYRQKTRAGASASSNGTASNTSHQGPDEEKIKAILDRTGYSLDVTTGQRKYGGPPPGWDGASPGNGCEVRETPLRLFRSHFIFSYSRSSVERSPKTFTRMN